MAASKVRVESTAVLGNRRFIALLEDLESTLNFPPVDLVDVRVMLVLMGLQKRRYILMNVKKV